MEAQPICNRQPATNPGSGRSLSDSASKRSRVVVSQSKHGCVTCASMCSVPAVLLAYSHSTDQLQDTSGQMRREKASVPAMRRSRTIMRRLQPRTQVIGRSAACPKARHHRRWQHGEAKLSRSSCPISGRQRPSSARSRCLGLRLCPAVESGRMCQGRRCRVRSCVRIIAQQRVVETPSSAWSYYGSALAKLRSDFDDTTARPESLALASMILACVEILSQHERNALTHFLGAVQIK